MINDAQCLQEAFQRAQSYNDYVNGGTPEQQQRWSAMAELVSLTNTQRELIGSFVREMKVLVISGLWCGDCVEQCPLLAAIAQASDKINLRFLDRDAVEALRDAVPLCGGNRVPVALFLAEDYQFCGMYGDRTLTRYRRLAEKQLGAACSTGLFAPATDEIAATCQNWVDEFERIHLMLRLSTRLRAKYQD